LIGDNLLKSNRELHSPHSLFGVMSSGISGNLGADDYDSMYESRSALTTVQKQHFVEWFSGSALDSIWTLTGSAGVMNNAVDGGYKMTTAAGQWEHTVINFNNKRQYSKTGSVIMGVFKRGDADSEMYFGGSNDLEMNVVATNKHSYLDASNVATNVLRTTGDGVSNNDVSTSTATNTNYHAIKIESKASTCECSVDGVLEATSSTNLSTTDFQPAYEIRTRANVAKNGYIRYMEAYNT
jgi:hypothetical protein